MSIHIVYDGTKLGAAIVRRAAGAAIKDAADEVLGLSEPEVPVAAYRGGFLKMSGEVDADLSDARATVSYDSPPTPADGRNTRGGNLAVFVHENTRVNHPVGSAKFLEKAFKSFAPRFQSFLASSMKRRIP